MQMHTSHGPRRKPAFDLPEYQSYSRRIRRALKERSRRAAQHRKAMRNFEQLLDMPEYLLGDIGLTRSEILADRQRYRLGGDLPYYNR